jgi:phosphoribosyl-ATP pyrophosphohydrolase
MNNALIYSVRFLPKLGLPQVILDNISKLRTVPAAYRPNRPVKQKFISKIENWRLTVLVDFVRKVRETDDPQYDQIFMILNKISSKTMDELSAEALSIVKERDEQFRLRVTTLIFDKAIKGSAYAGLMSDIAQKMAVEIPEVAEDLETHALMFTTLYDMSETLVFPKLGDADFEGKVILWSRQKDVRRGYARFLTHLFSRGLVSGKALQESMQKVIEDLRNTVIETKTEQSEENVTQFADFLYEIAKLLNPTAVELRGLILSELTKLLARPRPELPSLNMRSRFKLEDTVKCVKVC